MLILFHNGRIIASAEAYEEVYEWMIVEDHGKVRAIGIGDWPRASFTKVHDLKGCTVLPGLNDAHLHCLKLGKSLFSLKCSESKSIEELQQRLATYVSSFAAQTAGKTDWVFGYGWEQDKLGRYPTRHDLDRVVSDRPVVLFRVCEHICVVNTAGLRVLKLTSASVDPQGGKVDRESGSDTSGKEGKYGMPNGILRETATELVRVFLKDDPKKKKEYILASLQYCLSNGITAVQTNDTSCWQEYQDLAQQNLLPIRVFLTIDYSDFRKLPNKSTAVFPVSEMLACKRVKLFTDGSLGAETAALSLPYHSSSSAASAASSTPSILEQQLHSHSHLHKDDRGVLIMPQPELDEAVKAIHGAGFQLEIHTIGDRSAQAVLQALKVNKVQGKDRPVLTHCQVLNADLVKEMGALPIVANIQPQFVTTDSQWVGDRLHPSLVRYSYAWKTLAEAGVRLAGSSDAPVEDPNPFKGMHAAVYRYEANSTHAWRPEEALTKQQALHLYTIGSAYGCWRESTIGQLKPGYCSDFVVVPTQCWNSTDFDTCRPQEVWVAGIQRFSSHDKAKL